MTRMPMNVIASMIDHEVLGEGDGPRVERKTTSTSKDDEEQRHEVVLEIELHPAVALGLDTALVGVVLHRVGHVRPELQRLNRNGSSAAAQGT